MSFTKQIKLTLLTTMVLFLTPTIGKGNNKVTGNPDGAEAAFVESRDSKILETVSEDLILDLQTKDKQCSEQLRSQYNDGTLSPLLQPYYSGRFLDIDSLIQDEVALTAYFKSGCLRIRHFSVWVSDFPIDVDSHDAFYLRGEDVDSNLLTPIQITVETEIQAEEDKFVVSYIIYSKVLKDELTKGYVPEKFQEIGFQLIPAWGEYTEYFNIAFRQNEEAFSMPSTPGKIQGVRIRASEGRSFKSRQRGVLLLRLAPYIHTMINLNFALFDSVN